MEFPIGILTFKIFKPSLTDRAECSGTYVVSEVPRVDREHSTVLYTMVVIRLALLPPTKVSQLKGMKGSININLTSRRT